MVVGVHAPEFGFEHDLGNVRRAIAELGVGFPVVIDNEFAIWRAFENHYWPAVYLVDGDGRVRFHHFGEEAYGETERTLQQLLGAEGRLSSALTPAGSPRRPTGMRCDPPRPTWAPGARRASTSMRGPTGSRSTNGRSPASGSVEGANPRSWTAVRRLDRVPVREPRPQPGARAAGRRLPVRFTVRLDGEPPGEAHGLDADASGHGTLAEPRMYQLVRQPGTGCASGRSRSRSTGPVSAPTSSRSAERRDFRRSGTGRRLST